MSSKKQLSRLALSLVLVLAVPALLESCGGTTSSSQSNSGTSSSKTVDSSTAKGDSAASSGTSATTSSETATTSSGTSETSSSIPSSVEADDPTDPVNTTPVVDSLSAENVPLPSTIEEGEVWLPGPLYFGDPLFKIDSKVEYAKGAKSLRINLNKAVEADKESGFILPFTGLKDGGTYDLTFYAQGSKTYNGALSAIMGSPNYTHVTDAGEVKTMLSMSLDAAPILTAGAMTGADWTKISIKFTAHPKEDICSLRFQLRFLAGWTGQLWLSYFEMNSYTPVSEKDTPQVTAPVLTSVSADAVALPSSIPEGGVWEAGPLYSGDPVFALDPSVEYAKGASSISVNFNTAVVGTESVLILPFSGLTSGSKYTLSFYIQGSTNFNGCFSGIFENPNYTTVVDGSEVRTMLNVTSSLGTVCTEGGLLEKGWQKVSLTFTANPKNDLCSIRIQFRKQTGWVGTAWLSYFEVAAKDMPQVSAPVLDTLASDAVALPDAIPAGGVWEAGPLYSGDNVFSLDSDVEYAKGAKSIAIDYNSAVVGTESVLILPFAGLTNGSKYTLSFYIQGSTKCNAALSDVFENPNYTTVVDGSEVRTMLNVSKELGVSCTPGALLGAGWQKVSLSFTANPKNDLCSLRIQFRKLEGWIGTAWLSYFEVASVQTPVVEGDTPQVSTPVLTSTSANFVALPTSIPSGNVWEAGPLYSGEAVFAIDSKVEYATGAKSIAIDYNTATVGTESVLILPFAGLTSGSKYTLSFYIQGSTNFNGSLNNVFPSPNYTSVVDGAEVKTMLNVTSSLGKACTAGALLGAGWQKVSLAFTANPKNDLCALRIQFTKQTDWVGTAWLSYFEMTPKDVPATTAPVVETIAADAVALPDAIPAGGVWEAGPLYSGDNVFSIDSDVEYAKGAKSIAIDYNSATVGTESVLILPFSGLTNGSKYTLSFYIQGSTNCTGALSDVFENPNYTTVVDGSEVRTMLNVSKELGVSCTAGGLQGTGWQKVSLSFTANPKNDLCSLRIQFRQLEGWKGTAWLSYFEVALAA